MRTEPTRVDLKYLVRALLKYNASDLHLKVERPPLYRINGKLIPAKMEEMTPEQIESLIFGVLTDKQAADLERNRQVDVSFSVQELGRFRCNVFYQRGGISAVIRMIPFTAPNIDELGIPGVAKELLMRKRGLLLVTGSTGSGKSTTLASMIQHLNENHHMHILTMEDPIEFTFRDLKCSITQREVGSDIKSLRDGLYAGLRQDPDVIMIGELRDFDMIQAALTAAETGHLVVSTMHTNDAKSSIDRIIDVFPAEAKNQVRIQLASSLIGVISQKLVMRADATGRVAACEVMVKSPAIENYILKNELSAIPEAIANSSSYYKMQTMNRALLKLIRSGTVTADEALRVSNQPEDLKLALGGVSRQEGYEMANGPSSASAADRSFPDLVKKAV
jgi:twitching motility protein PilT